MMKNFNKTHWDFFFLMGNENDLKVANVPFKTFWKKRKPNDRNHQSLIAVRYIYCNVEPSDLLSLESEINAGQYDDLRPAFQLRYFDVDIQEDQIVLPSPGQETSWLSLTLHLWK